MIPMVDIDALAREVTFKTSRSSGAGGQHINKVETRVTLIWDMETSEIFSSAQKEMIKQVLASRINSEGSIQLDVSETRSQLKNKKLALERLTKLLNQTLLPIKKRVKTKIPRSVVLKRLDSKRHQAKKKAGRRWDTDV